MGRRRVPATVAFGLAILGTIALGCARATPIPAGAQIVHVTIENSRVVLEPTAVRAGDVYLVLDAPPDGTLTFIARQDSESATPGPMNDADIARVRSGDTFHTYSSSLNAGGCDASQNAEDRGKMGPCGNVMKVVVSPGAYALIAGGPDPGSSGGAASIVVLTVLP